MTQNQIDNLLFDTMLCESPTIIRHFDIGGWMVRRQRSDPSGLD